MLQIASPFQQIFDTDGSPLDNGYIYIGTANANPAVSPISLWWDDAGTIPAAQPIRTQNGYIVRNGTPARVYTSQADYSLTVKNRNGVLVLTVLDATSLADADKITFLQAGTGAVARTVQAKLRDVVSVKDFGAVGDGVTDDSAAIRAAVAAVTATGGSVYLPAGAYKVTAATGDTSNTAIYVPSNVRIVGASQVGTKIVPGANNTVCFRVQGLNGGIENLQIDNVGSTYTNVSAIRLAPTDEAQITTRSDIEFNNFTNLSIRRCAEAITLRPGPTVGAQDSYCYYNTFTNIDVRNCTLGIWLKVPPTQPGSGSNRNTFISCRVGETGTNTGLKIDAGDTNKFVACSFEGITSGVSPNATPTAVQIAYNTASYGCVHNQFFGLVIEACTRDIDNDNDFTEFYGYFSTGSYYSPSSRPLAVDIKGAGLTMNAPVRGTTVRGDTAVGTGRTPTFTGDFYLATGNSSVRATVGTSGAPEVAFDSPGNYGYFSGYSAGVLQWSIGSVATGIAHIGFLDGAGNLLTQIRTDTGELRPGTDNAKTLGSASFRWSVVYAGTGTINTSDAREKQQVRDLSVAERAVAVKLKSLVRAFKFNDAVEKKGDGARVHFGVIAQDVKVAFESEGLVAEKYAILCYDEWEAEPEMTAPVLDDDGKETGEIKVIRSAKPAGNRYGVRYEQLLAFIIAAL